MEKNPYTLAKLGLDNNAMLRPQRDCGFYAKYIFLFLSLIQFLIILGLVLFMVYGNNCSTTEDHVRWTSAWLQECRVQTGALAKEKANITKMLNASRAESRQLAGQLTRLNGTLRACNSQKLVLQEQVQRAALTIQSLQECYRTVSYLNATYPGKVSTLEAQLTVQTLHSELEKENLTKENQRLQALLKRAEKEEADCQLELLQIRTQVQKTGELEAQVMSEIQAASQNLKSTVERVLPSQYIWSCSTEEIQTLQTKCNSLSKYLEGTVTTLLQKLEGKVNDVAKENGGLQKEKAACSQDRQALSSKLTAQEQQATQDRDALQLACSKEKAVILVDQQKTLNEREALRRELDGIKQKCWVPPQGMGVPGASGGANPFPGIPGNFNPMGASSSFNQPWPRTGGLNAPPSAFGNLGPQGNPPAPRNFAPLGNISPHRTSGHTGHAKPEEGKKPARAVIPPYQFPPKPAGQPS
ncbi:plasmalemma vesicle-associated protein isoform X2 [Sphaerodactylus townsendi]|nr:plasmalemma vesicle-associated protein isoform X2 [Sphaerodactylus townsendi]